jgi:hypothetical protein
MLSGEGIDKEVTTFLCTSKSIVMAAAGYFFARFPSLLSFGRGGFLFITRSLSLCAALPLRAGNAVEDAADICGVTKPPFGPAAATFPLPAPPVLPPLDKTRPPPDCNKELLCSSPPLAAGTHLVGFVGASRTVLLA